MKPVKNIASSDGNYEFADCSNPRKKKTAARIFAEAFPYSSYGPELEPWPPPPELSQEALRDSVIENGNKYGCEFLIAIDGSGNIVESVKGEAGFVKVSKKLWAAMTEKSSNLEIHHNHAKIAILSRSDLSYLIYEGVRAIFAHSYDGGTKYTSRASLSRRGREVIDRYIDRRGAKSAADVLRFVLRRDFDFDPDIIAQIRGGVIGLSEANICRYLALPEAINRTGLFNYCHNYPPPQLLYRHDIQRGIDVMAFSIANALSTRILRRGASCRLSYRDVYKRAEAL